MTVLDTFQRPLRNLRISVTDRCNLRCAYCMPEESYVWLPREDLLSYEEIARLARVFSGLGVEKVRLTGGEPLLRRDLPDLVRLLRSETRIRDIALTTNGLRLRSEAAALREAGLDRVTVSLDTLDAARFERLTRRSGLAEALAGLRAARDCGFPGTKLNMVVLRGFNDDELVPMLELGRELGVEVRFIEYMDVGGATEWSAEQIVPRAEILQAVARRFGEVAPASKSPSAPADRYRLPDGTVFGVIASTTAPFCSGCDRSRLTADGRWFLCLYAREGLDLRGPLRAGASDAELAERLAAAWGGRSDRGAEERLGLAERGALATAEELRARPHLEMHTRGG